MVSFQSAGASWNELPTDQPTLIKQKQEVAYKNVKKITDEYRESRIIKGDEVLINIQEPLEELKMSEGLLVNHRDTCKEFNMYDKNPLTGFIDDWGFCTPGLVTTDVWFTKSPKYVYGNAVVYSPGMMRATATWRRMNKVAYSEPYLGGVATPSPADIGETVWLRRQGKEWEGPYLVVDCSRRADMYTHIAINRQVVEIDFDIAVSWGLAYYTQKSWVIDKAVESSVEVFYGKNKPSEKIRYISEPIFFPKYWLENIADYQREKIEATPLILEFGINPVWDLRNGEGKVCFTEECNRLP